jgi:hypothetical protein
MLKDANGCDVCQCAPGPDAGAVDAGGAIDAGVSKTCDKSNGCSDGGICGYPTTPACTAEGICFPQPGATCASFSPGCACDGTTINLACTGLPADYATKPLYQRGACVIDAGAVL